MKRWVWTTHYAPINGIISIVLQIGNTLLHHYLLKSIVKFCFHSPFALEIALFFRNFNPLSAVKALLVWRSFVRLDVVSPSLLWRRPWIVDADLKLRSVVSPVLTYYFFIHHPTEESSSQIKMKSVNPPGWDRTSATLIFSVELTYTISLQFGKENSFFIKSYYWKNLERSISFY